jgi:hypothetical protein
MKRDYGRTTITVPWELKARMKKARSRVNWSAVACDAFEQKLEELGPIEDITSFEGAVERMKAIGTGQAGQSESNPEANESGLRAGKHWAMNFARPDQLKRIEELRDENVVKDCWKSLMNSKAGWKQLTECLAPRLKGNRHDSGREPSEHNDDSIDDFEPRRNRHRRRRMGPRGGRGRNPHREVWRSILNERPGHPGFFLGFATGALEVWDQIKDQF